MGARRRRSSREAASRWAATRERTGTGGRTRMRCDVRSSVCSRLSPWRHEGPCDSPRAFLGLICAEACHEFMGREEAIAGWKQWEETAGCCSSPVLPTGVDGPRVTASRSRGSRGTARICSGGQEEDEEEWCLNCYQHSGSRFHQGHQGAESGSRGQVCLDEHVEQRLPGPRDVDETGTGRDLGRNSNLPNLGHLSSAQREVVGRACPACRRVSSVGGLTSLPLCVQPLEAPQEADQDASPSAGARRALGRTLNLPNLGHLSAAQREVPLETPIAPREVDRDASPSADTSAMDVFALFGFLPGGLSSSFHRFELRLQFPFFQSVTLRKRSVIRLSPPFEGERRAAVTVVTVVTPLSKTFLFYTAPLSFFSTYFFSKGVISVTSVTGEVLSPSWVGDTSLRRLSPAIGSVTSLSGLSVWPLYQAPAFELLLFPLRCLSALSNGLAAVGILPSSPSRASCHPHLLLPSFPLFSLLSCPLAWQ